MNGGKDGRGSESRKQEESGGEKAGSKAQAGSLGNMGSKVRKNIVVVVVDSL